MKIKQVAAIAGKLIPSDVKCTTGKIYSAVKVGSRAGHMRKGKGLKKVSNRTQSVFSSVKKLKFKREEYPAVAAALTYMIPIPSPIPLTPIVYGLGKLVNKVIDTAIKIKAK